jgi:hypothetical protein
MIEGQQLRQSASIQPMYASGGYNNASRVHTPATPKLSRRTAGARIQSAPIDTRRYAVVFDDENAEAVTLRHQIPTLQHQQTAFTGNRLQLMHPSQRFREFEV